MLPDFKNVKPAIISIIILLLITNHVSALNSDIKQIISTDYKAYL